jgi:hypothetical protein
METENKENIINLWFYWQFFESPKKIFQAWKNFFNFGLYYFSIPFLIKTLFSPWRKYHWSYPRGFDIGKYLEVFFSNLISRMIGAILRIFIVIFGILFEIFVIFFGFLIFWGWIFLPIILILLIIYGLWLLL